MSNRGLDDCTYYRAIMHLSFASGMKRSRTLALMKGQVITHRRLDDNVLYHTLGTKTTGNVLRPRRAPLIYFGNAWNQEANTSPKPQKSVPTAVAAAIQRF